MTDYGPNLATAWLSRLALRLGSAAALVRAWPVGALAALLVTAGCRQLLSTNSYDVATDAGPTCELARPVGPPVERNVPGAFEYTFVVRQFDVGDRSLDVGGRSAGEIGYDVDGMCTAANEPGRCRSTGLTVDGPGGRDNALGALIANIQSFVDDFPLTVQVMNREVEIGRTPPQGLFRIRDYGGDRNDDHVAVDWFLPAGSRDPDAASIAVPTWTTADHWPVLPDQFVPAEATNCGPPSNADRAPAQTRTSTEAYVTGQQLVAHFPDGMPVRFWIFEAPMVDVVMTADLVFNFNTQAFEMHNGIISGRAPGSSLLHEIPKIQGLFKIAPQCRSHPSYQATKQFVCSAADWSCASNSEAKCDWFSIGIAFETAPASVGETMAAPEISEPCSGDENPGTDTCADSETKAGSSTQK